jgi:phosphoenolpyruvate synthase
MKTSHILWMRDIGMDDVSQVGGKNASLGEMIRTLVPQGVRVPEGFCVTADAYYYYLKETGLDIFIEKTLEGLNTKNLKELSRCGKLVRDEMRKTPLPEDLKQAIVAAYWQMEKQYGKDTDVAVRSSATAEDLPGASFAGEQETYLNIRGSEAVVRAAIWTMASLFTDRAISYRADKGFDHMKVALSVGVQKMVRSDKGASGVMFSVDTESGFRDVVVINATYGLGEMIVQGHVTPDEYLVSKSRIGTVPYHSEEARHELEENDLCDRPLERAADQSCRNAKSRCDTLRAHRRRDSDDGFMGRTHRKALHRAREDLDTDGHGVGERRRDRRALHRAGAARDGAGGA